MLSDAVQTLPHRQTELTGLLFCRFRSSSSSKAFVAPCRPTGDQAAGAAGHREPGRPPGEPDGHRGYGLGPGERQPAQLHRLAGGRSQGAAQTHHGDDVRVTMMMMTVVMMVVTMVMECHYYAGVV